MANQGKRMVPEYLIKKIGEGGGGTEYTAGTGIDITEDVISVDTETVAMKSDLATVATTGDYDDLTNKPTILTVGDVTSKISANSPINKSNQSGGAIVLQLLKDEGSLTTSGTNLTLVDGISGKYDTEYLVTETTDYTVSGNTMTLSSTDFQNAVCRTLVATANHTHTFGWKVHAGTSSGISSGTPTVSSNTYTYTGNFSFVFTDNLDGTFTITTPLSITLTVAPTTDVTFSRFPVAANLVKQMDAKFIPIDGTSITVDGNGKLTASGGSSYTFTNGLTESSGTVTDNLYPHLRPFGYDNILQVRSGNLTASLKVTNNGEICLMPWNNTAYGIKLSTQGTVTTGQCIYPSVDNGMDLGKTSQRVRDAYISGNISDGTNSVNVADLAALIAYAKTQGWIQ